MRAAMERRDAPGLLARARAPRDPHFPQNLGSRKLGVLGRQIAMPDQGGLAHLLGASRRSIPFLLEGEGKQGDGPSWGPEKQSPGTAERWLNGFCGPHNR